MVSRRQERLYNMSREELDTAFRKDEKRTKRNDLIILGIVIAFLVWTLAVK